MNKKDNIKLGAVLSIHGGPTAQERPYYDYSGLYQYLGFKGIVVIAPNFRGVLAMAKALRKRYIMIGEAMNLKISNML